MQHENFYFSEPSMILLVSISLIINLSRDILVVIPPIETTMKKVSWIPRFQVSFLVNSVKLISDVISKSCLLGYRT
jgi:hypothetical protein